MEFLAWVEQTAFSLWITGTAFPAILTFHSVAMGFLVGVNIILALRILGVAPAIPLPLLERFLPLMWLSFIVILISGILLLIGYPAKALTNSVFYLKMVLIAGGFWVTRLMTVRVLRPAGAPGFVVAGRDRMLAATSLLLWAAVITAGRFLAYTYTMLYAPIT